MLNSPSLRISRFDDVKEIQKLSGMGLVACSSGKHKGQTKIKPLRTQETALLAVSGGKVSSVACG